jgi:hypothetical protein
VNSVFEVFSHLNCVSYIAAFWRGNFGGNYKFSGGGAGCAKTVHSYFKEEGTTLILTRIHGLIIEGSF